MIIKELFLNSKYFFIEQDELKNYKINILKDIYGLEIAKKDNGDYYNTALFYYDFNLYNIESITINSDYRDNIKILVVKNFKIMHWDGSAWVNGSYNFNNANTVEEVENNFNSLEKTDKDFINFYFQLSSAGDMNCKIDSILFEVKDFLIDTSLIYQVGAIDRYEVNEMYLYTFIQMAEEILPLSNEKKVDKLLLAYKTLELVFGSSQVINTEDREKYNKKYNELYLQAYNSAYIDTNKQGTYFGFGENGEVI